MPNNELNTLVLRRFETAQSLAGRFALNLHVEFQRLRASWLSGGGEALKRGFDIAASSLALVTLAPLFALIAILVKFEDGGPVFFLRTRVGQFGREFKMFKIRSMCLDAEQRLKDLIERNHHKDGVTFKIKDDPRITRVGKWLRKFSFDELPQLYNVLIGDMSLVGPRPSLPREVKRYTLSDHQRLAAKPGITCIWQISGRSEIDFAGQVKLDVSYIERQTFWMDVTILLRTVPAVLSGKGAC